ncbi:MAG: hypothetical protein CFE23_02590 [Flavobacterium sp. BFFFF1]|uniref:hypothetical protein n=1 Tax=Flavobacterium sp. BFFFF1 TaxID=2015557 RepID=UPI000BC8EF42|nr:hypothetical protein [Flavobacterium sp. BFFFF1]OYU81788.1 MAG: hypothetical protein CFE23_02590 [Flavobacterium sp. BFFFF1]
MKTLLFPLCFAIAVAGCTKKQNLETPSLADSAVSNQPMVHVHPQMLINPGISIGMTAIEESTSKLAALGQPDESDAAMGKAWLTWYAKNQDTMPDELNIYTTYKDKEMNEKVIRQIRVTSSEFKTKEGINTQSSLAEIKSLFPNIQPVGKFDHPDNKIEVMVYDDAQSGIAFEIENPHGKDRCSAIIVHPKNKKVTEEYLYLHPYMVVL